MDNSKNKTKVLEELENSDLAEATKRTYVSRINSLWKIPKWNKDPIDTVEKMNPSNNLNTEVNCTSQILALTKVSKTFKKMIDDDDMTDLRLLYDKLMTAQKQIDRSEERENDLTWNYILSLGDNLEKKNITGDDRLIYHLYVTPGTGFIPRLDYADMKIVDTIEESEDDESVNYYVKDAKKFIFHQYKTKERYGTQKVKISKELDKLLPKHQEWMFEQGGRALTDNALGKKLSRAFYRLSDGKKISVVTLRRAYASFIKDLPDDERRKIALQMGHSSSTNSQYAHDKEDNEINSRVAELE